MAHPNMYGVILAKVDIFLPVFFTDVRDVIIKSQLSIILYT